METPVAIAAPAAAKKLTAKDFKSENEVRWCPGCGDYAIMAAVQRVMPDLGVPKENVVFVSGIGCSSRFPYYMNTYGFHTIHGRAPAIASGVKLANPNLQVWVVTGDGDALAIGGNHFIHLMRRNLDIKVLLFNNRIYGLTKGQYSPTSEQGKKAKSTPFGSIDRPFNPVQVALGAGATFVARAMDSDPVHMAQMIQRAAAHKGTAFIEILQNCVVFNDGAFDQWTEKTHRDDHTVRLEQGKPVMFAKGKKGLKVANFGIETVDVGEGGTHAGEVLTWSEKAPAALSFALAELEEPMPMGVFRQVEAPTLDSMEQDLQRRVTDLKGKGDLFKLLRSGDTWRVGG